MTEEDISVSFDWLEYSVCGSVIGLSGLIGVYYAFCSKQNTVSEYMLGGKKMGIFPIAMSLIASHISCISLLGVPAEVYTYGCQFLLAATSNIFGVWIIIYGFLPVFYNLQIISINEYLELRFSKTVRKIASLLFSLYLIFYIPIVIYTVSLAFEEVSGIDVFIIAPIVSIICIFYTTVGGLKAVVWTDTLQGLVTLLTVLIISVVGTIRAGGFLHTLKVNYEGGVFDINLDINPFQRLTFWTVFIGHTFGTVSYLGTHAGSVQRFSALPSIKNANWSVVYMALGTSTMFLISGYVGFVLFAIFQDCNPLISQRIKRMDQMLPYLIMQIGGSIRGLSGLFIAGVFSAGLGAMSAGLNTLAGVIYEDFISQYLPKNIAEKRVANIIKVTAVVLGATSVILVFFVDKLKGIIQITMSFTGLTSGGTLGLFTLGMFFPSANKTGALYGGVSSLVIMAFIVFGNQINQMQGRLTHNKIHTTIDNCPFNVSHIQVTQPSDHNEDVFILFRLSFMLIVCVGCLIVVVVGLIVSQLTGPTDPKDLNPELISPLIRKYYYKEGTAVTKEMYVLVNAAKPVNGQETDVAKEDT